MFAVAPQSALKVTTALFSELYFNKSNNNARASKEEEKKTFCSNLTHTKAQGKKCEELLQLVENPDIVGGSEESCQHFIEWTKVFTFSSC